MVYAPYDAATEIERINPFVTELFLAHGEGSEATLHRALPRPLAVALGELKKVLHLADVVLAFEGTSGANAA